MRAPGGTRKAALSGEPLRTGDPLAAAEVIDDHRDMRPRLTHLHEEIKDRYGRRDKQDFAQQPFETRRAALRDRSEYVLDVHKPDHVVERLAIDRHAGMAVLDHAFDDIVEGLIDVERDDIDARHHDIGGVAAVALQ